MKSGPLLAGLLKRVSRSFYLTLRVLPARVRPQIGLAYLLARATDTIADTEIVPLELRLEALQALRGRIMGSPGPALRLGDLATRQATPAERTLLERCEEALALLAQFSAEDQQRIRAVLETIISGQELDLRRFAEAKNGRVVALRTDAELDDYTYRVAGCVGEFWTRVCRANLFPRADLDDRFLLENGVRFGKGLQLVNILRDLPADLRQGRCYVPAEGLAGIGLSPEDLLDPQKEPRFRPRYDSLLDRAEAHLAAGWDYTNALPAGAIRVRLACAWPVLIGIQTIAKLRTGNILAPDQRIKISRTEVRNLMLRSVVLYPWPAAWRGQFARTRGSVSTKAAKPGEESWKSRTL